MKKQVMMVITATMMSATMAQHHGQQQKICKKFIRKHKQAKQEVMTFDQNMASAQSELASISNAIHERQRRLSYLQSDISTQKK